MRDCIRDLVADRGMTDYLGWSREVEVVLCFYVTLFRDVRILGIRRAQLARKNG